MMIILDKVTRLMTHPPPANSTTVNSHTHNLEHASSNNDSTLVFKETSVKIYNLVICVIFKLQCKIILNIYFITRSSESDGRSNVTDRFRLP